MSTDLLLHLIKTAGFSMVSSLLQMIIDHIADMSKSIEPAHPYLNAQSVVKDAESFHQLGYPLTDDLLQSSLSRALSSKELFSHLTVENLNASFPSLDIDASKLPQLNAERDNPSA